LVSVSTCRCFRSFLRVSCEQGAYFSYLAAISTPCVSHGQRRGAVRSASIIEPTPHGMHGRSLAQGDIGRGGRHLFTVSPPSGPRQARIWIGPGVAFPAGLAPLRSGPIPRRVGYAVLVAAPIEVSLLAGKVSRNRRCTPCIPQARGIAFLFLSPAIPPVIAGRACCGVHNPTRRGITKAGSDDVKKRSSYAYTIQHNVVYVKWSDQVFWSKQCFTEVDVGRQGLSEVKNQKCQKFSKVPVAWNFC
jgi:hypothetical protein